jgi:lipopolysaccharide/colanic/teichoic acid biosynthesis glycosyltransferase
MSSARDTEFANPSATNAEGSYARSPTASYLLAKRTFDICLSTCLLPIVAAMAICLIVINPFLNRGPLLFIQERMGRDRKVFKVIKFRTMAASTKVRQFDEPIERNRITRLGSIMRRTRVDELPQVINVFWGDMSLIGPRPDMVDHSETFCELIPGYGDRFSVRPGISGLAQVVNGYAEGVEATREKARLDAYYAQNASFSLDTWILFKTIKVVFTFGGA